MTHAIPARLEPVAAALRALDGGWLATITPDDWPDCRAVLIRRNAAYAAHRVGPCVVVQSSVLPVYPHGDLSGPTALVPAMMATAFANAHRLGTRMELSAGLAALVGRGKWAFLRGRAT